MPSPRAAVVSVLAVATLFAMVGGVAAAEGPASAGRYIVMLDGGGSRTTSAAGASSRPALGRPGTSAQRVGERVAALATRHGFRPAHVYRSVFQGFAAQLTDRQVGALRADPSVLRIVRDLPTRVDATDRPSGDGSPAAVKVTSLADPVMPTGVRRIRAHRSAVARIDGVDQRVDADVAIIDTGIDRTHPDLDVAGGRDCSSADRAWGRDGYGHGTHVAGTVGAIDNGLGVVGVAPGARLWAVKVFDDAGEGWQSWWICGIDWVTGMLDPRDATRPLIEVANMSVRGPLPGYDDRDCGHPSGDLLHQALCRSVAGGTVYVVAAGNDSTDARIYRPAAYDEAITVSALADFDGRPGGLGSQSSVCPWYSVDEDDTFGNFSNHGADVDLIAPGKCILSTYPDGLYAWMTGTSMATPTVAGVAALYKSVYPSARPAQVRQALQYVANLDWATETDPDGRPDRLVDAAAFSPIPDFTLVAGPSEPLRPGGLSSFAVDIARTDGHTAPVELTLAGAPADITATLSTMRTRSSRVTVSLSASGDAISGRHELTLTATDGDVTRTTVAEVVVEGSGPRVDFLVPNEGTSAPQTGDGATVTWAELDPGGWGITGRSIQRQEAPLESPGRCAATRWSEQGPATELLGQEHVASGLAAGRCHRWIVRLTDATGITTRWGSGAILIDTTPPAPPSLTGAGSGIWQAAADATIFFRGEVPGTLTLVATGRDAESGVDVDAFGPLANVDGWTHTSSEGRDPYAISLERSAGAASTTITATSRDRAGLVGPARSVEIVADVSPPTGARWESPASDATSWVAGSVALTWDAGLDGGSGVADHQALRRERASPVTPGTCEGVSWTSDGGPLTTASPHTASGLVHGTCYRWRLTAVDRVGNAAPPVVSGSLLADTAAPSADFTLPDETERRFVSSGSATLEWLETDAGAGIASRSLQRQRGAIVTPGTCAGVTWIEDGAPVSVAPPVAVDGLLSGSCYRFALELRDAAGNAAVFRSGRFLADVSAPEPPSLSASGADLYQAAPNAPVYVRGGVTGSLTLTATGRDPESGVASSAFGSLAAPEGWTHTPGAVDGNPASVLLGWSSAARDTALEVTTTNRAGTIGPARRLPLLVDDAAPTVDFTFPADGGSSSSGAVTIAWSESDAAAGVDANTRRLLRMRADRDAEAGCASTWVDDGPAIASASPVALTGLPDGCYRWSLRIGDRVGNVAEPVVSGVLLVDATAPVVDLVTPDEGTFAMTASPDVEVAWSEADAGGSDVVSRTLQRQRASVPTPGTCSGAAWTDDGPAASSVSPVTEGGLPGDACYRWLVRLTDGAGNTTRRASGVVLVDTSAPSAPSVRASGTNVWQAAADRIVYVDGGGDGTLTLSATGSDPASGVAGHRFGALVSQDGWIHEPAATGDPGTVAVGWTTGATETALDVGSRNGAGLEGPVRTIRIRSDAVPPVLAFTAPLGAAWTAERATVSWTESDGGAGVGSRSVQRQRAVPVAPGRCDDVAWTDDGAPITSASPHTASGLVHGTCYRWLLMALDRVGNAATPVTSGVLIADTAAPDVTSPSAAPLLRGRVGTSGDVPIALRWTGTDTGSQGLAFELRRLDGTVITPVARTSVGSVTARMAPATTATRWGVRGADAVGNTSPWREGPPLRMQLLQASDQTVSWSGAWIKRDSTSASGGALRSSTEAGARATFRFTGLAVGWVTTVGPDRGRARVFLDGAEVAIVDLSAPTPSSRRMMFTATWPVEGEHSLRIRVEGTSGRPRVDVDAFVVMHAG